MTLDYDISYPRTRTNKKFKSCFFFSQFGQHKIIYNSQVSNEEHSKIDFSMIWIGVWNCMSKRWKIKWPVKWTLPIKSAQMAKTELFVLIAIRLSTSRSNISLKKSYTRRKYISRTTLLTNKIIIPNNPATRKAISKIARMQVKAKIQWWKNPQPNTLPKKIAKTV